jgi:hypothetical protein
MDYFNEDSIITEVRKNRADIINEYDGDTKKYLVFLISQKPVMEAEGWRYESEAELDARIAWHKQQREAEQLRIKAI